MNDPYHRQKKNLEVNTKKLHESLRENRVQFL